ncbi:MAG: hypothetical protein Kow00109_27960 [Acidobacteriota bacterium]
MLFLLQLLVLAGAPSLSGGYSIGPCPEAQEVVARVGGQMITEAELCAVIAKQLASLEMQKYRLRKTTLERLIEQRLLVLEAQARGLSPEELRSQIERQAGVTAEEVQSFYDANFHRFADLDEARARESIREFLANRKKAEAFRDFLAELRERYPVAVLLDLPAGRKVDQPRLGTTLVGGPSSPVAVSAFIDFSCLHCAALHEALRRLAARFPPGNLWVRYLYFPSRRAPESFAAADAAECAAAQGRFAAYVDRLFRGGRWDEGALVAAAAEVGLEREEFTACRQEHRYRSTIAEHLRVAGELEVTATPTWVINGRLYEGGMAYDDLERIVQRLLPGTAQAQGEKLVH